MRSGASEAGISRKSDSKSSRSNVTGSSQSSAAAAAAAAVEKHNKAVNQNLQNALNFGDQLQFMAMPVSFPVVQQRYILHTLLPSSTFYKLTSFLPEYE